MVEWEEYQPQSWIAKNDGKAVVAFRFETPEINASRHSMDRDKYVIGSWNSWIKTDVGSVRLVWPENTPIEFMKSHVESTDIRLRSGQ